MSNRALLLTLLAVSLMALPALAQVNDLGFGANGSIQIVTASITGSVNTVDGRALKDARVELHDTNTGAIVGSTYTRINGSFELYNIPRRSYEVVATKGVVEARERIDLNVNEGTVNLKMPNPVDEVGTGGSTVSVAQYKVSPKARKEFDRAQKAFDSDKFDEAKDHLNKALEVCPQFAEALTLRGILAINDKNSEQGKADFQEAMKYDPNYALAYFAMGAALNQTGKYDEAIRALQHGVAVKPDGWQGFFEMSKANLAKGDFRESLNNAEKAQQLANDVYAPIHVVKAHAYMGMKEYKMAVTELEHFLTKDPQGPIAASARQTLDRAKAFVTSATAVAVGTK